MPNLMVKSYLFIAGLIMSLVGCYIAILTVEYVAAMNPAGIKPSTNMLSDLRGMGGTLLMLGCYIFISTFRKAWWQAALRIATAVYMAFVVFRSIGILLDGLPDMPILVAYDIETVMACWGLFLMRKGIIANESDKLINSSN